MLRSNKGTSIPYREPTGIGLRASFILVVVAVCGAVWLSAPPGTGALPRLTVSFVEVDCATNQVMGVAEALARDPRVATIEHVTGGRDLLLTHLDEERKLEPKRLGLFLRAVYALWRNPVKLRANGKVYTYDRRGLSST